MNERFDHKKIRDALFANLTLGQNVGYPELESLGFSLDAIFLAVNLMKCIGKYEIGYRSYMMTTFNPVDSGTIVCGDCIAAKINKCSRFAEASGRERKK